MVEDTAPEEVVEPVEDTAPEVAEEPVTRKQGEIDALLLERAGYARRGLPDRVKQVDAQLALRGYAVPPVSVEDAPVKARGQRTAKA